MQDAVLRSYAQKLTNCRAQIATITGKLGEQKGVTVSESEAHTQVLNLLEDIQSAARQEYESTQTDTLTERNAARKELAGLLPEVATLRRKIQLAADGLWPYFEK